MDAVNGCAVNLESGFIHGFMYICMKIYTTEILVN